MKTSNQPNKTLNASQLGLFTIYALGLAIILLQLRTLLGCCGAPAPRRVYQNKRQPKSHTKTFGLPFSFENAPLPAILHWNQNHFVVLHRISCRGERFHIADPGKGMYSLDRDEFSSHWLSTQMRSHNALLVINSLLIFCLKYNY